MSARVTNPDGTSITESGERSEHSPLLGRRSHPGRDRSQVVDSGPFEPSSESSDDSDGSKSTFGIFLLTLGVGGLQIAWATQQSNGSPFLISLGLSKAALALVWIAGPLSGILVQPYIGSLSDRCRISWGKRKPFMIGGTIATVISLLAMSWCKEIVTFCSRLVGHKSSSEQTQSAVIIFAVIWVYLLDFSINTVQASLRAFIVDGAPSHQQEYANAWAGRLTGFGNIIGHLLAFLDLPNTFPFLGDTQIKVLCAIAAISLSITVAISALYIPERDPRLDPPPKGSTVGPIGFFRSIFRSLGRLPPLTRKVCEAQFFNWIGWFPFMFYVSTYIGQLFVNPILEKHPHLNPVDLDSIWAEATRVGSFSLFIFAITSFVSNTILPFFVVPTRPKERSEEPEPRGWLDYILRRLQIPGLTIKRAWLLAQILFAFCMASTFFITTPEGGNVLAGFVGVCWALTLWAPFALISVDISQQASLARTKRSVVRDGSNPPDESHVESQEDTHDVEDQAGVILGLHNVSISAPQIVSTLMSSVIFKITQRDRAAAGDDSVAWVLRVGGISSLVAAFMTARIDDRRDTGRHQDLITRG